MRKKAQDGESSKRKADGTKAGPAGPQIEVKMVKHTFSADELNDLGMQLARAHTELINIAEEFDNVKANFKAREAEQAAIIGRASSARMAGFEMRNARCRVVFRPKDRLKDFYLETADAKAEPVLTEAMTDADMQAHLIPAEPIFEAREEIVLWDSADYGPCVMQVGRLSAEMLGKKVPMWFAALDVRLDGNALAETLDNDQPCATKRIDIIRRAAKRLKAWLVGMVGKETAEGFNKNIDAAVDAQKEREE